MRHPPGPLRARERADSGNPDSFSLHGSEGDRFTILPIICGEKATPQVIERLRGRQEYLVVSSDIDRDFDYEAFTLRIQGGEDPFSNAPLGSPEWIFKTIFIDPWMRAQAMRRDGYLLVSDSGLPKVGLISMGLTPIEGLEISDSYLYGTIPIAKHIPVYGSPPPADRRRWPHRARPAWDVENHDRSKLAART